MEKSIVDFAKQQLSWIAAQQMRLSLWLCAEDATPLESSGSVIQCPKCNGKYDLNYICIAQRETSLRVVHNARG